MYTLWDGQTRDKKKIFALYIYFLPIFGRHVYPAIPNYTITSRSHTLFYFFTRVWILGTLGLIMSYSYFVSCINLDQQHPSGLTSLDCSPGREWKIKISHFSLDYTIPGCRSMDGSAVDTFGHAGSASPFPVATSPYFGVEGHMWCASARPRPLW